MQTEYSLLYRTEAEETRKVTVALGISFVAYSLLGRGFLSGALKDLSILTAAAHPRFQAADFAHNRELVARIEAIAEKRGCTPSQLASAWALAQDPDVLTIPGTRSRQRLDQNVGATRVALTTGKIVEISATIPSGAAAGERYPSASMKAVYL